jgi:hypothetical protein
VLWVAEEITGPWIKVFEYQVSRSSPPASPRHYFTEHLGWGPTAHEKGSHGASVRTQTEAHTRLPQVPPPFDDINSFVHYAAKLHPELSSGSGEFVVSFTMTLGLDTSYVHFLDAGPPWYYMLRFVRINIEPD